MPTETPACDCDADAKANPLIASAIIKSFFQFIFLFTSYIEH